MNEIRQDNIPGLMVVAAPNQLTADLGGEAAILNMTTGVYYGLDPIGAKIWQLVQKPISLPEISQAIRQEYEVSEERCMADILQLLNKLLEQGLVKTESQKHA